MKKKILIIENFEMTKALAKSLLKKKYKVTAINNNYEYCHELAEIEDLQVIYGDGTKLYMLEEAGADTADITISLFDNDADNLVVSQLCKKRFGAQKTVCTIKNAGNIEFFRKMGVDAVVSPTDTITTIIEQQTFMGKIDAVMPLQNGNTKIVEIKIRDTSRAAGKTLKEITLPKEVIIGCVFRRDNTIIPDGNTVLLSGDSVIVLLDESKVSDVVEELAGR